MARHPMKLILCPGLLCDDALWSHLIRTFSADYDIYVPDFRNCDSITAMAEVALENGSDRFALAGLSMGGYVAQEVMRLAPEKVTHLALLDTSARPDSEVQRGRRRDLIALAERGKFRGVTPRLLPLLVHESRLSDAPLVAEITEMAERVGKDAFLRHQTAIMNRPDGRGDLSAINCPTLVLCGRQDQLTPLGLHLELAERIPGADLVVLGHCGHMATMERPTATVAALKNWLKRDVSDSRVS